MEYVFTRLYHLGGINDEDKFIGKIYNGYDSSELVHSFSGFIYMLVNAPFYNSDKDYPQYVAYQRNHQSVNYSVLMGKLLVAPKHKAEYS